MKGASRLKTVILVVIMGMVVILGILGMDTVKTYMSGASADFQPSNVVSNVSGDGKSAVISWTTIKESKGYVEYGTTPASLLLRSEIDGAGGSTAHSVNLNPLKVNINYYYRIRVGDDETKKSEWEVFDNAGIPYSFNTKVAGMVSPSPTPTRINQPPGGDVVPDPRGNLPTAAANNPLNNCVNGTDYNQDGVANSLDMVSCLKGQKSGTAVPPTSPLVSRPPVSPTRGATTPDKCPGGVDTDGNGVINSLDVIKCLQGH